MEKSRREKLIQLYSKYPSILPASEVKPLKISSKDKFANTMEIDLDMAGNTQAKGMEALENGDADLGHWHLANSMEFIRNAHSLANLERLKIKDPSSTTAIKNYVEGAELITPQARKIIDEQMKLVPKFYKNSYSRRRNSYSSGYSANQLASQIAKSLTGFQTGSFFQEGGEDLGRVLSNPKELTSLHTHQKAIV
jgi:hypothetical protein